MMFGSLNFLGRRTEGVKLFIVDISLGLVIIFWFKKQVQ